MQLSRERIPGVGILIHVVARQQSLVHAKSRRKIVADDGQGEGASVEPAVFPRGFPAREHAEVVDPVRELTGCADTGDVFLRKPHVVAQVAAVDGEQLFRRSGSVHCERDAVLTKGQFEPPAPAPHHIQVREAKIQRGALLRVELHLAVQGNGTE